MHELNELGLGLLTGRRLGNVREGNANDVEQLLQNISNVNLVSSDAPLKEDIEHHYNIVSKVMEDVEGEVELELPNHRAASVELTSWEDPLFPHSKCSHTHIYTIIMYPSFQVLLYK